MKSLIIKSKKYGIHAVSYDEKDHDLISKYSWHLQKGRTTYYAITNTIVNKKKTVISMHRLIKGLPINKKVDHKDHNGLNNISSNIRACSSSQNSMNSRISKRNISGYKGVTFYKPTKKYQAFIMLNKKQIHLGYFPCALDAAITYNEAAKKHFGEFAYLNTL